MGGYKPAKPYLHAEGGKCRTTCQMSDPTFLPNSPKKACQMRILYWRAVDFFYLLGREKQSFTARKYIERELRDHLYGLKRCGIGMHDEGMMELFTFKRNIFTSEKLIEISACPTCNGKGVFVHSFSGDETETRVCARCNGNGIA